MQLGKHWKTLIFGLFLKCHFSPRPLAVLRTNIRCMPIATIKIINATHTVHVTLATNKCNRYNITKQTHVPRRPCFDGHFVIECQYDIFEPLPFPVAGNIFQEFVALLDYYHAIILKTNIQSWLCCKLGKFLNKLKAFSVQPSADKSPTNCRQKSSQVQTKIQPTADKNPTD